MALAGGKLLGFLSRLKAARAGRIVAKGVARALPVGKRSALLTSRRLFKRSRAAGGPALRTARLGVRYLSELGTHGLVGAGLGTAGVTTAIRRSRRSELRRTEMQQRSRMKS